MPKSRFQYQVATGRMTLPVASFLALLCWFLAGQGTNTLWTLAAMALTAYLLIEQNTRFALIRARTTLPSGLYLMFAAVLPGIYVLPSASLVPIGLLFLLSSLFGSYEMRNGAFSLFNAFFWLGVCTFAVPSLTLLVPLLYMQSVVLRSFSARSFFAGVLGMMAPYWLLLGYALCREDLDWFLAFVRRLAGWTPIDYAAVGTDVWISWAVVLLIAVTSGICCLGKARIEKVQTRIQLRVIVGLEAWLHLTALSQPQHLGSLLPSLVMLAGLTTGYFLTSVYNRFTRLAAPALLVLWLALALLNIYPWNS